MTSKLFKLASEAARHATVNQFARTPAGQLLTAIRSYSSGRVARHDVEKLAKIYKHEKHRYELSRLSKKFGPHTLSKYALNQDERAVMNMILDVAGPIGKVIKGLWNSNLGTFTAREAKAAVELLRAFGGEVLGYGSKKDRDRGIDAAREALESSGYKVEKPSEQWTKQDPTSPLARALTPPKEGEQSSFSKMYLTPTSSNVYSFQFDFATGTMFVRFKAPVIDATKVTNVTGRGGIGGMKGGRGTLTGRNNDPGPLYAYLDVSPRVFKRLVAAIGTSAGKGVWDNLRIRGTVYGHQFRYILIQGALVPGEHGEMATYVPRRATPRGYRARSVPDITRGRWVESTLQEELRARPGPIDRGRDFRSPSFRGRGA